MTEPTVDAPAADPTVKAGEPVAESARIAELEAKLKKQEELLEKNKSENVALHKTREELEAARVELAAAKNPPTMNAADPTVQAEQVYYQEVMAAYHRNEPWAVVEVKRMQQQQQRDLENAWTTALSSVPAEIRDEVEKEARGRQIHPKVAQELVENRKQAAEVERLRKEAEELRKDREAGGDKPSVAPGGGGSVLADAQGAMNFSAWRSEVAKVKARYDASGGSDDSARKELNRLTAIRDSGNLILDR